MGSPGAAADPFAAFKAVQREGWARFVQRQVFTVPCAGKLVRFARLRAGEKLLDVACGTGVVAVTAARRGARVTGLDLTPALLAAARENALTAGVEIDWHEGDAEALPFKDGEFDAVVSQFGHIFAPRADAAIAEMLRVLKPGGTVAFSTWPPEMVVGKTFALTARYLPPPPPGATPPIRWGEPAFVAERLGTKVKQLQFEREVMLVPALSLAHFRGAQEKSVAPVLKVVETLSATDPARLAEFRREYDAINHEYFHNNTIHQHYLMARAIKI